MTKPIGYIESVTLMAQPDDANVVGGIRCYHRYFTSILAECSDRRLRDIKEVLQFIGSNCEDLYTRVNAELESRDNEIPDDRA